MLLISNQSALNKNFLKNLQLDDFLKLTLIYSKLFLFLIELYINLFIVHRSQKLKEENISLKNQLTDVMKTTTLEMADKKLDSKVEVG